MNRLRFTLCRTAALFADHSFAADDLKKVASALDGYRFEVPCRDPMPENPKPGADGISARITDDPKTNDKFTDVKNFGGEAGKRYRVTLRVRGVVEPMMYKDGQQVGECFYIGGVPNNKTYNIHQLNVSSPAQHFFFNRDDKVGHRIFTIPPFPRPSVRPNGYFKSPRQKQIPSSSPQGHGLGKTSKKRGAEHQFHKSLTYHRFIYELDVFADP